MLSAMILALMKCIKWYALKAGDLLYPTDGMTMRYECQSERKKPTYNFLSNFIVNAM